MLKMTATKGDKALRYRHQIKRLDRVQQAINNGDAFPPEGIPTNWLRAQRIKNHVYLLLGITTACADLEVTE